MDIDPVWDELFPAEQQRIARLLLDRVVVNEVGIDVIEAFGRLTAMRASRAIAERLRYDPNAEVPERIEVLDGEGRVLFEADLRREKKR